MTDPVGISSRWAPDRVTPREDQQDQAADVVYRGLKYSLVIAFQGKADDDAAAEGERALSRMFQQLWLLPKFREQCGLLHIHAAKPLVPCVTFNFNDLTLFVAASSTDAETARVHAIDRLALAIQSVAGVTAAQAHIKAANCEVRYVR